MPNIEEWYEFGQQQQDIIEPILINYFGDIEGQSRWSKFDFIGEFINIEVKSRQGFGLSKYPTTMMSCDKAIEEEGKDLYFVFNFVYDINNNKRQIYFIKYNKDLFDTFEITDLEYFDGTCKSHFLIPTSKLTKLYEDIPDKPKCRLNIKKILNSH